MPPQPPPLLHSEAMWSLQREAIPRYPLPRCRVLPRPAAAKRLLQLRHRTARRRAHLSLRNAEQWATEEGSQRGQQEGLRAFMQTSWAVAASGGEDASDGEEECDERRNSGRRNSGRPDDGRRENGLGRGNRDRRQRSTCFEGGERLELR